MTPRRFRRASAALGCALALSGLAGTVALAAETDTTLPPASPGPRPEEGESPVPASVPPLAPPGADEAGRVRAQAELKVADKALRAAKADLRRAERTLPAAERRLADADAVVAAVSAENAAAAAALAEARERVRQIAIAGYLVGGAQPVDYLLRSADPIELERRRTIVQTATEAKRDALEMYAAAQRATSEKVEDALAARDEARAGLRRRQTEVAAAAAVVMNLNQEVENRRLLLDLVTAAAPVAPSDIPRMVLDAYRKAAAALATRAPGCRVSWSALAAIGRVESNHGRYRGAQLALNGDVWPRILGIPLDGTRSARIEDTDLGFVDGDPVFDRAVGPMQFIPSTWRRVAQDGNGDGLADPNNVYDAALGAAVYLCRAVPGGGLDTDDARRVAFFSYNRSTAYVDAVLALSHEYEAMTSSLPASVALPRR